MYKILTTNGVVTGSWSNTDYVAARTVPGHPFISSSNDVSVPAGTNENITPNSGSDGWLFTNFPVTDPQVSGSLWASGSSDGPDNSKIVVVSQGA